MVHFHREKFITHGGPDGGDGGKGGDVVFEVKSTLNTLSAFRQNQKFRADDGDKGGSNQKSGKYAEDLVIPVPPGTVIFDADTGELIGDWITEETTVAAVCEFGEKVYLRKDLTDFKGDPAFAQNEEARKTFAKLRSAIGGLYAWRAEQAQTPGEKQRLTTEADLAFRQALALCPDLPEAVFRYVNLLLAQKRKADARLVAGTFSRLAPKDENLQQLQTKINGAE